MTKEIIKAGSDVFIHGACYDEETGELEVYSLHDGWWGIQMPQDEADRLLAKLRDTGVFFYHNVRHVGAHETH